MANGHGDAPVAAAGLQPFWDVIGGAAPVGGQRRRRSCPCSGSNPKAGTGILVNGRSKRTASLGGVAVRRRRVAFTACTKGGEGHPGATASMASGSSRGASPPRRQAPWFERQQSLETDQGVEVPALLQSLAAPALASILAPLPQAIGDTDDTPLNDLFELLGGAKDSSSTEDSEDDASSASLDFTLNTLGDTAGAMLAKTLQVLASTTASGVAATSSQVLQHADGRAASAYTDGQAVRVYSLSRGCWLEARVTSASACDGAIEVAYEGLPGRKCIPLANQPALVQPAFLPPPQVEIRAAPRLQATAHTALVATCPAGHLLQPSKAMAGTCNGCWRRVAQGEQVSECRLCNWYLCASCHPFCAPRGDKPQAMVATFWGAVVSMAQDMSQFGGAGPLLCGSQCSAAAPPPANATRWATAPGVVAI